MEPLYDRIDLVLLNTSEAIAEPKRRHNMHSLKGQWTGSNECHKPIRATGSLFGERATGSRSSSERVRTTSCSGKRKGRAGDGSVGTDSRSGLVELVYVYDADDDYFFVFHGMTPPSGKALRELGLER